MPSKFVKYICKGRFNYVVHARKSSANS